LLFTTYVEFYSFGVESIWFFAEMADFPEWDDNGDMEPVANNNAGGLVTYFASLYEGSLVACDAYLVDIIKHVELLYGANMGNRLRSLSLVEDEKKLSGLLILLGVDGRLAGLNGVELLRILNVDLVGHLNVVNLQADLLFDQWVFEDDTENLDITYQSISFLYGVSVEWDFKELVYALRRLGSSLKESVGAILAGIHGPYFTWGYVACKLYDEWESRLSPPDWDAVLFGDDPEVDQ
jgi:hypothetical protein